jgi:nucleoside-diphosphate-sugar epimerase
MNTRLAILGASSKIAKDMIAAFARAGGRELLLYVRDEARCREWVRDLGLHGCSVHGYAAYGAIDHDAVINFVGIGDPGGTAQMGSAIFDVTRQYDDMALAGLEQHPRRRYIFLSSGAAYGSTFLQPAGPDTMAQVPVNQLQASDYYGAAKLAAECRHRARPDLAIVDLRVFNYFSRTQDIGARFFITDIVRAIRDRQKLHVSPGYMVRDFMHPSDFARLVECVLAAPPANMALDCYSREPVDKPTLLAAMQEKFGLQYEMAGDAAAIVNATGSKPHYYSRYHKAAELGFVPRYSSLEAVLEEATAILSNV